MKQLSLLTKTGTTLLAAILFLTRSTIPADAASNTASSAEESAVTLKMGSPAPKLQVGQWVQGEPVKEFEPGKAYIVEFWATWCGPCKVSIPHLNAIHKKYQDKGLIVIGQDVLERDDTLVAPFVKKMADNMTYRVAMDDKSGDQSGKMLENWMTAAGKNAIPVAFLINRHGIVAWIGHPMELEDEIIEAVLADKFDITKAAAAGDKRTAAKAHLKDALNQAAEALQSKDLAKAEASIAECEKLLPPEQGYQTGIFRVQLLILKGDQDGALKLTEQLAKEYQEKVAVQNFLAQLLTRVADPKPALLDTAERIAKKINDTSEGKDITSVYTLGRVAFLKGQTDKAIEYQTKVIELTPAASKARMQEYLDSYKAGKLPGKTIQPVNASAKPVEEKK